MHQEMAETLTWTEQGYSKVRYTVDIQKQTTDLQS